MQSAYYVILVPHFYWLTSFNILCDLLSDVCVHVTNSRRREEDQCISGTGEQSHFE